MIKKGFAIMILAAVMISVNSYGQQRGGGQKGGRGEMFKKMDTNGDGKLSKAEVEAVKEDRPRLYQDFDKIDANGDAYLQKEEMRDFMQKNRKGK